MDDSKLYQYYSSVVSKPVDWLWYPYIPYGKITLMQGDPGEGKSTFILRLIAIITRGGTFPNGEILRTPQPVIYQCSEDGGEDTIKPRLLQAGADCKKVAFIMDGTDMLTLDDARIEQAICQSGARLLVLDPIQAYIGQDGDMQSATRMRNTMRRLACVAERYNCAIVLIGHLNKSCGGKTLYRGLGGIDIAAIARSVLLISRDVTYPTIRYMHPIKASLTPESCGIAFLLDPDLGFQWIGKCSGGISESSASGAPGKKERAKAILKILLSNGSMKSADVQRRMKQLQISERTMRTASKELGVIAYKRHKIWYQRLPARGESNEQ